MDVQVSNIKSIFIAISMLTNEDLEKICTECGISPKDLDDNDAYLHWQVGSKATRMAYDKTGIRLMGLQIGSLSIPATQGPEINELFTYSSSFLQSGLHFIHFSKLIGTMFVFSEELTETEFKMKCNGIKEFLEQDELSYKIGSELNIMSTAQICKILSQERILPKRFEFELHREPEITMFLGELFPNIEVIDNQSANALVFDRRLIETPNPFFDLARYNQKLQAANERMDRMRSPDLKWKIFSLLYDSLTSKSRELLSLDETAAVMNTTARTLNRRLQETGTSFMHIKDDVRKKIVNDQILSIPDLKIDLVASKLNMDVPQFSTWFKKAFGVNFGEYK